jgi:hypothetical protein
MTMTHYHHGHGLAGYGPEEPETCHTLECLAYCVHSALGGIVDAWMDQAHGERFHVEKLRKLRPTNGSDPVGYPGSWESIADAALRTLECLDKVEEVDMLRLNLRPERRDAPLYHGNPEAWQAEVERLLLDSGTYPLDTDLTGNHRFYVYGCGEWACLLNEHDTEYQVPTAGGHVPCVCRDCMETLVWSPDSGEAPYCHACVDEACHDRDRGECLVVPAGDE